MCSQATAPTVSAVFEAWVNVISSLLAILCCVSDFYESSAVMLEEEGAVIVGLLVGLNVIDANLCVKGEDLDTQVWGILLDLFSSTRDHIISYLIICQFYSAQMIPLVRFSKTIFIEPNTFYTTSTGEGALLYIKVT